jgi:hypothetical protein
MKKYKKLSKTTQAKKQNSASPKITPSHPALKKFAP